MIVHFTLHYFAHTPIQTSAHEMRIIRNLEHDVYLSTNDDIMAQTSGKICYWTLHKHIFGLNAGCACMCVYVCDRKLENHKTQHWWIGTRFGSASEMQQKLNDCKLNLFWTNLKVVVNRRNSVLVISFRQQWVRGELLVSMAAVSHPF